MSEHNLKINDLIKCILFVFVLSVVANVFVQSLSDVCLSSYCRLVYDFNIKADLEEIIAE